MTRRMRLGVGAFKYIFISPLPNPIMKILLDTNFILTAVKQKIDFERLANELFDEPLEFLIPLEVTKELESLSTRLGEKTADKEAAKLSLEIIEKFDEVPLGTEIVDNGIVKYAGQDKKVVIATLDRDLKKRFKNKILTIRGKNSLEIIQ